MRHNLLLLSAFTVAATLSLGASDAEAAKQERASAKAKVTQVSYQKSASADRPSRTRTAKTAKSSNALKWDEANLRAFFIKDADGNYHIEELPGAKNENVKLPIASVAKMAAAAVVFDAVDSGKISLDDMVPILPETWTLTDSNFARKGLSRNLKEIPVKDALAHTVKLSSNPMTRNLAVFVSGSQEKFVALMNAKAKQWGMTDTNFVTPDGLPDGNRKEEHTTAKDLMILTLQMWKNFARFKEYTDSPLNYWNPPKPTTAEITIEKAKESLRRLGAIFKTGTVKACDLLVTVAPVPVEADKAAADIQVCAKKWTRFARAENALTEMFGNQAAGPMMGPERPTVISAVSSLPDRPSEP